MNIRERSEQVEKQLLIKEAALACNAKRDYPEEHCPIRTAFQRDRDRILHSNSFRRMKHKTQVYIAPKGDHYRTRMTHTLEVAQIGRTIARALSLNEDLTEAIAFGHDMGHTPFGHVGESALNDICGHFKHNEQGVRIVEHLEKNGQGLNLTNEVRDGILHHTGNIHAYTWEGRLIKYADRIAYLCHDFDDAERSNILTAKDLPVEVRELFGMTHSDMITAMVMDLITYSLDKHTLSMSPTGEKTLLQFRKFMFENVYIAPIMVPDRERGYHVVTQLYSYFIKHSEKLPEKFLRLAKDTSQAVTDYISGLTDNRAISLYQEIYVPRYWNF